ncbi:hypothetical protein IFR05_010634 [Cadophora sp. M221]|nr:hypothetical protein IFR05_010634 [Cadophora sp. M221]
MGAANQYPGAAALRVEDVDGVGGGDGEVEKEEDGCFRVVDFCSAFFKLQASSFTLQSLQDFFKSCQGQAVETDIFTSSTDPPTSGLSARCPVVFSRPARKPYRGYGSSIPRTVSFVWDR